MRFLIVTAAIFACAAAAPSSALLATSYSSGVINHGAPWAAAYAAPLAVAAAPLAVAHAAPVAVPTISSGDVQAAAIDAHVEAADHARATVDTVRQINDQAAEIQGRAINAAEDHAWQAVNAAQTAAAQIDGAAANASPAIARQAAGQVAPVAAYAAPVFAAPALAARAFAAPLVSAYGVAPVYAGSQSVSTQSLSQTHPVPFAHAPVAYAAHAW
ncbi:larval/pupal cuticle protein H1C-like [Vanessa cardui]|uniref:larval/pupal cuticle protein H1C-like n=1 Tax=Vanessa cardui TaxID=171605 RepID=UPI001F133B72|nr:larval/pupal cuticle protein H1C-like [Vanessa cardui]